jgi:hypothetical protein
MESREVKKHVSFWSLPSLAHQIEQIGGRGSCDLRCNDEEGLLFCLSSSQVSLHTESANRFTDPLAARCSSCWTVTPSVEVGRAIRSPPAPNHLSLSLVPPNLCEDAQPGIERLIFNVLISSAPTIESQEATLIKCPLPDAGVDLRGHPC